MNLLSSSSDVQNAVWELQEWSLQELNLSSDAVPPTCDGRAGTDPCSNNVLLLLKIPLKWSCASSPVVVGVSSEHKEVTKLLHCLSNWNWEVLSSFAAPSQCECAAAAAGVQCCLCWLQQCHRHPGHTPAPVPALLRWHFGTGTAALPQKLEIAFFFYIAKLKKLVFPSFFYFFIRNCCLFAL